MACSVLIGTMLTAVSETNGLHPHNSHCFLFIGLLSLADLCSYSGGTLLASSYFTHEPKHLKCERVRSIQMKGLDQNMKRLLTHSIIKVLSARFLLIAPLPVSLVCFCGNSSLIS